MGHKDWYAGNAARLQAVPPVDSVANTCYRSNTPFVMRLPDWPIFDWSLRDMEDKVGSETNIQFQAGRSAFPDYEIQSHLLRSHGSFGKFLDLVLNGVANDVYLVAQNAEHNRLAMRPLHDGIGPLPEFLAPYPAAGFIWIGGATMTPLHHDITNNLMCQVLGEKHCQLVSPDQFDRIDHRAGVHSNIGWLTNELAAERGIAVQKYYLRPRDALFLPVGWWHCVRTDAPSVTVVYTNFVWDNGFGVP